MVGIGSKPWQTCEKMMGRDKYPSPTCTSGTRTKRVMKRFLQMTSFLDKRKEESQCREEAYELEARLEESLQNFFPVQGGKAKEKTIHTQPESYRKKTTRRIKSPVNNQRNARGFLSSLNPVLEGQVVLDLRPPPAQGVSRKGKISTDVSKQSSVQRELETRKMQKMGQGKLRQKSFCQQKAER